MAKRIAIENELEALLGEDIQSVKMREKTSFDNFVEPLGKLVVLFGAGELGKKVLARLRQDNIEPLAFSDNNTELWGRYIEGVIVLSPEEAAKKYSQIAAFIVTIWSPQSGHRFSITKQSLIDKKCMHVMSYVPVFWKYPETFLPEMYMDLPHKILEHAEAIRETFSMLSDYESRLTFLTQLKWRMITSYDELPGRSKQTPYFPDDLFALSGDEVYVDCGAYVGDTIDTFLKQTDSTFNHIVAVEPDPSNFNRLSMSIQHLPDRIKRKIILFNYALGKRKGELQFRSDGAGSSMAADGEIKVDCEALNHILKDRNPTFIKMDIEGAEIDALIGASRVIAQLKPILAISAYHQQNHLWEIPKLIQSFSDQYKYFFRAYDEEGWDLVCFAIPSRR